MESKEKIITVSSRGGHESFYKGNKKQLRRAVLLSLALCGGMTFMGADTAYAGNTCTISHDAEKKTTTVETTGTGTDTNNSTNAVYGNSNDGTAKGYTVTMSGGKVSCVHGGHAENYNDDATASSNTVTISGGTVTNEVCGGGAQSNSDAATASSNEVTISGGNVNKNVYGGYADSTNGDATASSNKVTISGVTVTNEVYGGYAYSTNGDATASSNKVTISGGNVNYEVYGGKAKSDQGAATASSNEVTISVGTVGSDVYGGYATNSSDQIAAASQQLTASSNTVNISGGTVGSDVYGGYATNSYQGAATASSNTVNISGGTVNVNKSVYGGFVYSSTGKQTANDNVINLLTSGMTLGNLYGYSDESGTTSHSGNTLNVCGKNITVTSVQNFDNMNFFLPTDMTTSETMLIVNNMAKVTNAKIGVNHKTCGIRIA